MAWYTPGMLDREIAEASRIARQAGAILIDVYRTDFQVAYKDESDPVTEADTRANAYIVGELRKLFPDDGIVAEESEDRSDALGDRSPPLRADQRLVAVAALSSAVTSRDRDDWMVVGLRGIAGIEEAVTRLTAHVIEVRCEHGGEGRGRRLRRSGSVGPGGRQVLGTWLDHIGLEDRPVVQDALPRLWTRARSDVAIMHMGSHGHALASRSGNQEEPWKGQDRDSAGLREARSGIVPDQATLPPCLTGQILDAGLLLRVAPHALLELVEPIARGNVDVAIRVVALGRPVVSGTHHVQLNSPGIERRHASRPRGLPFHNEVQTIVPSIEAESVGCPDRHELEVELLAITGVAVKAGWLPVFDLGGGDLPRVGRPGRGGWLVDGDN